MKKYKLILLLLLCIAVGTEGYAQQYVWANNQSSSMEALPRNGMYVFANNSIMVSAYGEQSNGYIAARGAGNGTAPDIGVRYASSYSNITAVYDTNMNMTYARANGGTTTFTYVADPLVATDFYEIAAVATCTNACGNNDVSYAGWDFTSQGAYDPGKIVVTVRKVRMTGTNGGTTLWVRFIDADNSGFYAERSVLNAVTTVVSGQVKLAVSMVTRDNNGSPAIIGVYSNGVSNGVATATNNTTHQLIKTEALAPTTGTMKAVVQFNGDGAPEWLNTFRNTTSNGSVGIDLPLLSYDNTGNLFFLSKLNGTAGSAGSYELKQFTGTSGVAIATNTVGTAATNGYNYALFKLAGTTGAMLNSYETIGKTSSGTFNVVTLNTDGADVFLSGQNTSTSSQVYDADGTGGLASFTTQGLDLIVVKVDGTTFLPVAAAKFGTSAEDRVVNVYGGSDFYGKNAAVLDKTNGWLYFPFTTRSTTNFTQGTASFQMANTNGGSGIYRISTSTLAAVDGISLYGTHPTATLNSYLEQRISGVDLTSTGDLYIMAEVNQSAELRVNGNTTPLKTFSYYNGAAPFISTNRDVVLCKINSALTATDTGGNVGFSGRANNNMNFVTTNGSGNPVFAGTLYGTFSWDGTSVGGTAGTVTSVATGLLILEVDKVTGIVKRAYFKDGYSANGLKYSAFDNSYYIANFHYNVGSGSVTPFGIGAPVIDAINNTNASITTITKLDTNFNFVSTIPFVSNDDPLGNQGSNNGLSDARINDFDIDPVTGDLYILGIHYGTELHVFTNKVTAATSFDSTFGATSSNLTFVGLNYSNGFGTNSATYGVRNWDRFVVKFNAAGTYQWGKSIGGGLSEFNEGSITYLNNKVYFTNRNNTGTGPIYFGSGATSGQNGTNLFTPSATASYLLSVDAATGNNPVVRDMTQANTLLQFVTSNKAANKVYCAAYSTSGASFGGVSHAASGARDSYIFEINPTTLLDEPNGSARIGGNGNEIVTSFVIDPLGKLFFAGYHNSTTSLSINDGTNTINANTSQGSNDHLVGAVDPASDFKPIFLFSNGSVNSDLLNAVAPGDFGSVFVAGNLAGNATFGSQSLVANNSGDFVFGRIDYPYVGPGGVTSGLDNWFAADQNAVTASGNLTQLSNITGNSNFENVVNSGTVPYNIPSISNIYGNFLPSFTSSTGNTMEKTGIGAGVFTSAGKATTIFAVVKPTATTSEFINWTETTTNSKLNIKASNSVLTDAAGVTKTVTNTTAVPLNKWSLVSLNVTSTGGITNGLNGKANGTTTGAGALNTTDLGTFTLGGGTSTEVVEAATYGINYAISTNSYQQIASSLCLKYGITLDPSLPYRNSSGVIQYDHRTGGPEVGFANDIVGIGKDISSLFDKGQTVAANNALLTIGAGNSIALTEAANTAVFNNNDILIMGSSASANTLGTSKINALPPGNAFCQGFNIEKTWKVNISTPYANRSAALKAVKVRFKLSELVGMTTTNNVVPTDPTSYKLVIDRNNDGDFLDSEDSVIPATSLVQTSSVDDLVTFDNVEFDSDGSGSDRFILVWSLDGSDAAVYSIVGTSANLVDSCPNAPERYYRDPAFVITTKSYVTVNNNGNTFVPTAITATRRAALTQNVTYLGAGQNRYAALMNYYININDAAAYSTGGGVKVKVFYDAAMKTATDAVNNDLSSWIYFPGTVTALETAFTSNASLPTATYLTPLSTGTAPSGVAYVELAIPSGGTIAYLGYKTTLGIESCTIYWGTDTYLTLPGTHLFAKDNDNSLQLENNSPAAYAGTHDASNQIKYDSVGKHWYIWDGTNWYQVDNATNAEAVPTTNGTVQGLVTWHNGHVWGWDGVAWHQFDN